MNVQIAILEVEWDGESFALDCRKQGCIHIEIDGVAKLVGLTGGRCFHSGAGSCSRHYNHSNHHNGDQQRQASAQLIRD